MAAAKGGDHTDALDAFAEDPAVDDREGSGLELRFSYASHTGHVRNGEITVAPSVGPTDRRTN